MFRKLLKSRVSSKNVTISQDGDDTKIVSNSSNLKSKNGSCPCNPLPCDPCSLCSPCNPLYWTCCAANVFGAICCFEELCGGDDDDCCDNDC